MEQYSEACSKTDLPTNFIPEVVKALSLSYEGMQGINHIEGFNLPSRKEIASILKDLREIIFPGFAERKVINLENAHYFIGDIVSRVYAELSKQIARSLRYHCKLNKCSNCNIYEQADATAAALIKKLPEIRDILKKDVVAAYEGDPAAKSFDEIILSYPGIHAVTVHRIAHELYSANIPLIPRMMASLAYAGTGIDLHPGAKLGDNFFIDHGAGVVIGETAVIGKNVKIYQGVTLGALSFPKDKKGNIMKGNKRHPTLEDNVTVYSGATILGDIVIGHDSVIGGNVWLTENISPNTTLTIPKPELKIKSK
jgi:serine O-acetyltransferase